MRVNIHIDIIIYYYSTFNKRKSFQLQYSVKTGSLGFAMAQAEFTPYPWSYRDSDAANQVQHGDDGKQEAAAEAEDVHHSGRFLKLREA